MGLLVKHIFDPKLLQNELHPFLLLQMGFLVPRVIPKMIKLPNRLEITQKCMMSAINQITLISDTQFTILMDFYDA